MENNEIVMSASSPGPPISVVDMHLNPEKIGRETILVSKEAEFFVD